MEIILMPELAVEIDLSLSGYRLIPGYTSGRIGLPIEIFLSLYAVKGEEMTQIKEPTDLSRYVSKISSEDEAWHFLRLFSAIKTHFLFQKDVYTVDLGESTNGSIPDTAELLPGMDYEIEHEPPKMKWENGWYIASRDLIRADPTDNLSPAIILRRTESVSEDAEYKFIEDIIKQRIERKYVSFPSYE